MASLSKMLGKRVSIRVREPDGGARDLLGFLLDHNQIKRRDGSIVSFDPEKIIALREVKTLTAPAGRGAPLSHRIKDLEIALSQSWPPLEIFESGMWRYRFSDSQSLRANSVLPVGGGAFGEPANDLGIEINNVRKFYNERKSRGAIQVVPALYPELNTYLENNGWSSSSLIDVMVADVAKNNIPVNEEYQITITHHPDQSWLDLQGSADVESTMTRSKAEYLSLKIAGEIVAVGRIGYSENWAIFSRIYVAPKKQRQGIGAQILAAMLNRVGKSTFKKTALQVGGDNLIAKALYQKYGFHPHHSYLYRMAPENLSSERFC